MLHARILAHLPAHDRGDCRIIGLSTDAVVRLHRERRGNITLIFLFYALTLFIAIAMCWNTAHATRTRIEVQTVADTAAYSAATWTSRTTNIVTGSNMLVARHASALQQATMAMVMTPIVFWNWYDSDEVEAIAIGICIASSLVGASCCDSCAKAIAVAAYYFGIERQLFEMHMDMDTILFPFELIPFALGVPGRIDDIHDHAKAWVDSTPKAIDEQRKKIEKYYGRLAGGIGLSPYKIHLSRPGGGNSYGSSLQTPGIQAPVKDGDLLSATTIIAMRYGLYRVNGGWTEADFDGIKVGKGKQAYGIGIAAGTGAAILTMMDNHHVLNTQSTVLEYSPDPDKWKDFTVVAAAKRNRATAVFSGLRKPWNVRQGPSTVIGSKLMAGGLFSDPIVGGRSWVKDPDAVVAYAQAETYNGVDGLAGTIVNLPVPWRVWSTHGWNWQPRLTKGDLLKAALEHDAELAKVFKDLKITTGTMGSNWTKIDDATLH